MMRQLMQSWKMMLAIAVTAMQLTACGGGSGGGSGGSAADNVVISGSVGDGPITGATVTAYNAGGELLASVTSDIYATYQSTIKARGREYPLTLEVSGGIDLVTGDIPDFRLYSVAMGRKEKSVNINPFTTMAVIMARLMPGGVNADNIDTAMSHVTSQLGFGLDLKTIKDPRKVRITDKNVADMVKASEALGEMIRRTRDAVISTGTVVTGDDVMGAIAADMVDGYLDGAGGQGTRPAISAVATVVSGQVLVEALGNNLRVGGVIATDRIDQAIQLTHIDVNSDQLTDNVRITTSMLQQTQVALAAARVVDSSGQVTDIAATVDNIVAGSLPAVVAVLPAGTSGLLDNAVMLSSAASTEDVAAINQVVHAGDTGGSTVPANTVTANTVPAINGSPAGVVTAGDSYSFQPVAADADGNLLAFSISNKPGWASFSDTTGRLSGTPTDTDAGLYNNIVISVSDGLDSTSLRAFSIQVNAVAVQTGSFTLDWTAPVARADGTALSLADIQGYRIYYGSSSGDYPNMVNVADGSAQGTTVTNVPAGNYYITMTTYDTDGRESGYSTEITKTTQ